MIFLRQERPFTEPIERRLAAPPVPQMLRPVSEAALRKIGSRGFTLVELMMVMLIAAILAAIGLPLYRDQVERSRATVAVKDIAQISAELERFFSANFSYPSTLNELGINRADPWGNPYGYLNISDRTNKGKGGLRKDKNLNPLNSDFDLYSSGKDGQSRGPLTAKASRDDIIRAGNGSFIGRAEDH